MTKTAMFLFCLVFIQQRDFGIRTSENRFEITLLFIMAQVRNLLFIMRDLIQIDGRIVLAPLCHPCLSANTFSLKQNLGVTWV